MERVTAKQTLDRLSGVKDTYERHEVLCAMIEYAIIAIQNHQKNIMEILDPKKTEDETEFDNH